MAVGRYVGELYARMVWIVEILDFEMINVARDEGLWLAVSFRAGDLENYWWSNFALALFLRLLGSFVSDVHIFWDGYQFE